MHVLLVFEVSQRFWACGVFSVRKLHNPYPQHELCLVQGFSTEGF